MNHRDTLTERPQFIVTWVYPNQILSHNCNSISINSNNGNNGNECIYFMNEDKDFIPSPSPLHGLVFECGEINLHQYFMNNVISYDTLIFH